MEKERQSREHVDEQEKIVLLKKLEKAKSTKERVDLFGKVMDNFGIDAVISLVPELGDVGSSTVSTLYLLSEGKNLGFSRKESLKIIGYQATDILVGAVPLIGDIADYFFKANKRSAEIFSKHFDTLKKEAIKKGISQEEMSKIENKNNEFIAVMQKQLKNKRRIRKPRTGTTV